MKAIEVRDLVKEYGSFRALHGISFEVEEGEFFGLLGPNGAGKSTTLNILAGLTRPTRGQARVMGHDVEKNFRSSRRNLGVVPQELSFESFFSITRVLRLQSGYFGFPGNEDWIEELLHRLHLWDEREKRGRELSGGMKRRLLVAKALVHKPPVVILDEPTSGVDVGLRRELWDFIQEIHRSGTTILLTTHYLEEAEENCERIGILGEGRLLALERTGDLLEKLPDREVLLSFEGPMERIPPEFEPFRPELLDHGCSLRIKTRGPEERRSLWKTVAGSGFPLRDVEVQSPDLEDVFLEITGLGKEEE